MLRKIIQILSCMPPLAKDAHRWTTRESNRSREAEEGATPGDQDEPGAGGGRRASDRRRHPRGGEEGEAPGDRPRDEQEGKQAEERRRTAEEGTTTPPEGTLAGELGRKSSFLKFIPWNKL